MADCLLQLLHDYIHDQQVSASIHNEPSILVECLNRVLARRGSVQALWIVDEYHHLVWNIRSALRPTHRLRSQAPIIVAVPFDCIASRVRCRSNLHDYLRLSQQHLSCALLCHCLRIYQLFE